MTDTACRATATSCCFPSWHTDNYLEKRRNRGSNSYEDGMFKIKYFKKGTSHITFKRPELVDRLNDIIARHYPGMLAAR
ncbi:DUF4942 domain-containing protein [Salmonella enterica]|nr:DUF4942 domain-containing protein [Salmonella enterica]EMD3918046.1 DUF4942 domain-containing protein [Salmonella enterica]